MRAAAGSRPARAPALPGWWPSAPPRWRLLHGPPACTACAKRSGLDRRSSAALGSSAAASRAGSGPFPPLQQGSRSAGSVGLTSLCKLGPHLDEARQRKGGGRPDLGQVAVQQRGQVQHGAVLGYRGCHLQQPMGSGQPCGGCVTAPPHMPGPSSARCWRKPSMQGHLPARAVQSLPCADQPGRCAPQHCPAPGGRGRGTASAAAAVRRRRRAAPPWPPGWPPARRPAWRPSTCAASRSHRSTSRQRQCLGCSSSQAHVQCVHAGRSRAQACDPAQPAPPRRHPLAHLMTRVALASRPPRLGHAHADSGQHEGCLRARLCSGAFVGRLQEADEVQVALIPDQVCLHCTHSV